MKEKTAVPFQKLSLAVLIVFALISLFSTAKEIDQGKELRNNLLLQVESISKNNSQLEYAIGHSHDKDIIEDIARNSIGLVQSGEKIFLDVSN